jgi:hypothetical protein
MSEDRLWIYDDWNKSEFHSDEYDKTKDFIVRFFLLTIGKIMCPCDRYQNTKLFDKLIVTKYLCRNGFVPHYENMDVSCQEIHCSCNKRGRE